MDESIDNADEHFVFISVDVETAGPNPSTYSLLAIGACTLDEPEQTFYIELKPVNQLITPEAFAVHGLDLKELAEHGSAPREAMARFEGWLKSVTPAGKRPLFLAFNAPFDWMFVDDYFRRYLGRNPFGHTALDIKAFYMGKSGVSWEETSMRSIGPRYLEAGKISHNALQDAIDQGRIFRKMKGEKNGE